MWTYLAVVIELFSVTALVLSLTETPWAIAAGILMVIFTTETLAVPITNSGVTRPTRQHKAG